MTDQTTIIRPSQAETWKRFGITAAGVAGAVVLTNLFLNRETNDGLSEGEKSYLHETFQYTGGGLVLTALAARTMFKNGFAFRVMSANPWVVLGVSLVGSIGSMMGVYYTPPEKSVQKHAFWLAFNACQAATLSPLFFFSPAILSRAALYTCGVVGSLSYVGATARNDKYLYMGGPLLAGVTVVALSSLAPMALPLGMRGLAITEAISLYGGLAVFGGFVLYDTQKILQHARMAERGVLPRDPVKESISLELDMINIFANDALGKAEEAINAVAARKGSGKDGKAAAKKIISGARQVMPILEIVSEVHPFARMAVGTFSALIEMEASRQSNNLQIAVVYHSMTLMMHTLRYLGSLIDQSDELSDDLQQTLQDAIATMEEFGNLVNSYYRYSVKQAIFRVLRSKEYQEQLQEINDTFMRHREEIRNVLEARTMIATYDTRNSLQYVNSNIEKVISMLGAINAKEHKAEEFSRTHGGPEAIIHDDALLSKVAEILGEKLPPQIRSALRKDLQDLLENDLTQFKYALQATREQIDESVARSEVAIIRHLDSGPHELIQDPDVKSIWQEMKWRTSVKVRPFVDSLHEYFQRQFALKKLEEGEPPHDSWTLKYLSKVMYHPAVGNAIDEDGSGFVSVHELNHFLENRPIKEWTVPETLVFWSVVWPKSNRIYYEDIMYDLGRIKATIHHMKPIPEAYEEYLKVLDMLDPVVDSLGDGDDGEESEGLQRLLKSYVDVTDAKIQAFLKDTQYRISDTATLDFIIGKSQRIELVVAPLVWLVLNHHVGILEEHGSEIDPEVIGFMCETCISIFFSFLDRYSDLQRGWKQQKVNVALYMDSFASSVFSAMALAEKEGFFEELADNVDEYNDYDGQDDDDEATADSQDKTDKLLQLVTELTKKISTMETRLANMEKLLEGQQGSNKSRSGPSNVRPSQNRRGNDDDEEEGDDDNGRDEDDDEEDVGRNYDDEDEDDRY
ncbi:hypothetical protein ONZ45_g4200 [Pleurotus djamor]|nr:hypothetical protein ONZ45_g4200 [Pleurotus djamor]